MDYSIKKLATYLRAIREQLGYSTYDVNKLCDISPSYLSLVETGKRRPSPVILKKLSSIYHIDYNDLLIKAGFSDLVENVEKVNQTYSNNFRMASYDGIDTEGLDEQDIKEINAFVEFIKQKKKNNDK